MEDNYSHDDDKLLYIIENVPGPTEDSLEYSKIVENFNSQLTEKCDCNSKCVIDTCKCIKSSGGNNYILDSKNVMMKINKVKMKDGIAIPIIECNDLCSCSENCGNRVVQNGPLKSLYIKTCPHGKGQSLLTKLLIPENTFVCEYAGEVITRTQAASRHQTNMVNEKMNYIFCLNEHSNGVTLQTFIDPSECGNIGRYANHSCDPNCVVVPVRVNTPIPKLALFSCRDIMPHTEITFNYGSSNSENILHTNVKKTKCLCNTAKCTGWMPYQIY